MKNQFREIRLDVKSSLTGAATSSLFFFLSQVPVLAAPPGLEAEVAGDRSIDFTVKLPLRNSAELDAMIRLQSSAGSPLYHHFLSPAQFRASFGPTAVSLARAAAALRAKGLRIVRVDSQMLHVRGSASTIESAFKTSIEVVNKSTTHEGFAARTPLVIPEKLAALGAIVIDLSSTVRARPLFARTTVQPQNRYSKVGGYWFDDLKQAYAYPSYTAANGAGVTIATVGYSDYNSSDALAYFAHEKLGAGGLAPAPILGRVLLPGADPFDPDSGASGEADVDVQQAGGSAPGASVIGVAIDGPGEPFLNAYAYLDDSDTVDIVSTSYGECELYYTAAYNNGTSQTGILQAYHDLFRQGNAQGITFVFGSGDDSGIGCYPVAYFGAANGSTYVPLKVGAGIWVDDPNTTGVGGTNLITSHVDGSLKSTYVTQNETGDRIVSAVDYFGTGNYIKGALWGSGGGPSSIFSKPSFQKLIATGYSTRTVPDVAMHMGGCPSYGPGYDVSCDPARDSQDLTIVGGQLAAVIGTSASAPEFAGLLAVKESVIGSRLGNANEYIYRLAAANASGHYFKQGIYAYNGIVRIAPGETGYNSIVGVGTPIARNFVGLPNATLAGDPQTSSNP